MPQELNGTLTRLATFGRWGRGTFLSKGGQRWQVVGSALVGLKEAQSYRLVGEPCMHPKYGRQFEVALAQLDAPSGASIAKYLQKHYAGCGEKTATAIVDWYSREPGGIEALRSALSLRPWEIEVCPGLGSRRVTYLDESGSSGEGRVHRRLAAEVAGAKVPDGVLRRVATWLYRSFGQHKAQPVEACWERFRQDPYEPTGHVEGYGFASADSIAAALRIDRRAPCRLAAVITHAIRMGCDQGGHVFLTTDQATAMLSQVDATLDLESCVAAANSKDAGVVVLGGRLYEPAMERTERFAAEAIADMLRPATPLWCGSAAELDRRLERLELGRGDTFKLDESQREAIKGIVTSTVRIHTMTAPPGHGKTAVMEMLAGLTSAVMFAAPTGKAAKVLTASVERHGVVATTTHAMLEANGERFRRDRMNPLVANLVVLDEGGMQDIVTFAGCLDAMSPTTHLLMVGDQDQLEAVGRGSVLRDLLSLRAADHHRLTHPHRSTVGVLALLDLVRRGEMPAFAPGEDVAFVGDEESSNLRFEQLVELWAQAVTRHGLTGVGLLFAHRRGSPTDEGWNVTYANSAIQNLVNPQREGADVPGTRLRVGDRVIVRKNITLSRRGADGAEVITGQIVNGDTGHLTCFETYPNGQLRQILIELDEGREVRLRADLVKSVDLAYAQTVHSAQGSEFNEVIFVAPRHASGFANRRIFYTAASRAKSKLWLVGSRERFADMARRASPARNSFVPQRVECARGAT